MTADGIIAGGCGDVAPGRVIRSGSIAGRRTACFRPAGDDVAEPAGERYCGILPEYDFLMAGDGSRDGDDPETTEPVGADRSWVDDELLRTGIDLVGGDATGIGAIDGAGIFFIADGGARAICFGAAWAEYLSEDEP